jgi:hypothetical protein
MMSHLTLHTQTPLNQRLPLIQNLQIHEVDPEMEVVGQTITDEGVAVQWDDKIIVDLMRVPPTLRVPMRTIDRVEGLIGHNKAGEVGVEMRDRLSTDHRPECLMSVLMSNHTTLEWGMTMERMTQTTKWPTKMRSYGGSIR